MNKDEVKKTLTSCYKSGGKYKLSKELSTDDVSHIIDILWEYMEDSEQKDKYKKELDELQEKIKLLNNKSGQRVRCIKPLSNRKALIQFGPIKEEVLVSPEVNMEKLKPGTEVLVTGNGDNRTLSGIREHETYSGRVSKILRVIDDSRVVIDDGGRELILETAEWIFCKEGDEVRYELESQMVLEVLGAKENCSFSLTEVPDITFDDVKGLEKEKQYLQERLIYPSLYKDKFKKYGLKPFRAALFHGSPGCGKTFLAKAVFNEMLKIREKFTNVKGTSDKRGFFLINGPEVLSKWVGNTESIIRKIFSDARKMAETTGFPSIIFWDEIESIIGKRKETSTYSPEKTIVPTLLSEIQGINSNEDVILIGATNRPDLIDPALMRPGRFGDAILEIPKPTKEASLEILKAEFVRNEIPKNLKKLIDLGVENKIISHIYENETPLVSVNLKSGKSMKIKRSDQINGALFTQIGEELVRNACISEIQCTTIMTIEFAIQLTDKILLDQLGVLDAGNKNGFMFNTEDYIVDIMID